MPSYTTQDIRNIALVGAGGAGKTTLLEALLHAAGAIAEPGRVDKGTTVSDFDALEKDLLHSLDSAVASFDFRGRHLNVVDTPGLPDFLGRSVSVLPAVETVAVVMDPHAGVEMTTQRLLERAAERGLCRVIVINKIDAEGVDLPALLQQAKELAEQVKAAEARANEVGAQADALARSIPNIILPGVPTGGEDDFVVFNPGADAEIDAMLGLGVGDPFEA